jgi:heme-degrading monooxygenase HmoA
MILEIATIHIKSGENAAFEQALVEGGKVISQSKGYVEHRLHRCIEVSDKYVLIIKWQSLEDHTVTFRGSDLFLKWRSIVGPFFSVPPLVEHYSL